MSLGQDTAFVAEAKRLRERGLGWRAVGAALGVSASATWRACHPHGKPPRPTVAERILARVVHEDRGYETECWIWQGARDKKGYGLIAARGRSPRPHRLLYEEMVGEIPEGNQLDHLCRVRPCVNPAHLEPVTPAENTHRGVVPRLTPEVVREIRASAERGIDIAARVGISPATVSSVRLRQTWKAVA